jgi:hypothetical protein
MSEARDRTLQRVLKLRRLDLRRARGRIGAAEACAETANEARRRLAVETDALPAQGSCKTPSLLFARLGEIADENARLAEEVRRAAAERDAAEIELRSIAAECESLETFLRQRADERRRASKWR